MERTWKVHKGRLTGKIGKLHNPTILNAFLLLHSLLHFCHIETAFLKKREFNSTEPNSILQSAIYLHLRRDWSGGINVEIEHYLTV